MTLEGNVITSYVVYKLKCDKRGQRIRKARIVPHGNHDDGKKFIRKDSATAQLNIIRLLPSLTMFLDFRLGMADIKGAYLQSGPVKRDIFVRPPSEWISIHEYRRGTLWLLIKLPYGIVEVGRQWRTTIETWVLDVMGFQRGYEWSQLFIERNNLQQIELIAPEVTDEFLCSGKLGVIHEFTQQLRK